MLTAITGNAAVAELMGHRGQQGSKEGKGMGGRAGQGRQPGWASRVGKGQKGRHSKDGRLEVALQPHECAWPDLGLCLEFNPVQA